MSRVDFNITEQETFGQLQERMDALGDRSGAIIDGVLHGKGAEEIRSEIHMLLPESGRRWRGKRTAAKKAKNPFRQEDETLSVTVRTVKGYHYLYFPDDGHTTLRHAGNQEFMYRGAENASDAIVDMCITNLLKEMED